MKQIHLIAIYLITCNISSFASQHTEHNIKQHSQFPSMSREEINALATILKPIVQENQKEYAKEQASKPQTEDYSFSFRRAQKKRRI